MPKYLTARPPLDATEERHVRKLTHSVHAPADWIFHAKMVALSWDGLWTRQIAEALGCHPQTVRERLQAFNERGFEGLGMKPGGGRKSRLTEHERSTILYLIHFPPPGQPTYEPTGELHVDDPKGEVEWTLDALTTMARQKGIRWPAVKSGASSAKKRCAGGTHGCGPAVKIPTSSQKGNDRRPLHRSTPRSHRPLCRRTRSRNPAQFPAGSGLVARRAPDQGAPQLRPGTAQGLGLRGPPRSRWAGADPDGSRTQYERVSRVTADHRPHVPEGRSLSDCRQPGEPYQRPDPRMARC